MKEPLADPPRWRDHRDQCDLIVRTIGHDLRAVKTPAPLSGSQMARLAVGLRVRRPRGSLRWLVMAASLLLLVATAASAARLKLLPRWLTGANAPAPVPSAEPVPRKPSLGGHAHKPKPEAAPEVRQETPASPSTESPIIPDKPAVIPPAPRPVSAPSPRPTVARRESSPGAFASAPAPVPAKAIRPNQPFAPALSSAPSPSTAPLPSPHGPVHVPQLAMLDPPQPLPKKPAPDAPKPVDDTEVSKLLAEALRLVRAQGQPQAALALLDRQATRLHQSPYHHEALLIRVEALLALKRDADLLRLLDGLPLTDVAASRTLLSTRGRLRAAAQRCPEAVADFDRVLAEPGRQDKQALLGRALCREALGDREGANADREHYRQSLSSPRSADGARP